MKNIYGMGHAMEAGYRVINIETDGLYSCGNCRKLNDGTCPIKDMPRDDSKTCNYHKINMEGE